MSTRASDRLDVRLPADLKERIRLAAEARGESVSRFATEALRLAASQVLDTAEPTRTLGWAAGTARQLADVVAPAAEPGDWEALQG